ncbi:hypothetical protein ACFL0L_03010 [Patescibacteria group bacterium]
MAQRKKTRKKTPKRSKKKVITKKIPLASSDVVAQEPTKEVGNNEESVIRLEPAPIRKVLPESSLPPQPEKESKKEKEEKLSVIHLEPAPKKKVIPESSLPPQPEKESKKEKEEKTDSQPEEKKQVLKELEKSENKQEPSPPPKKGISQTRTTKNYQKVVILFSLLSIIVIAAIIYLSFTKTVISVTPAPVEQSSTFFIRIQEELPSEATDRTLILGNVLETTITDSLSYTNITSSGSVDDVARGEVTIFNNWSQSQPLIATTRLLSSDGTLFRIEDSVTVPAGGKVENVAVYADVEGVSGNIEPTTFTIPGLWQGLQEQIYAESTSAMSGGTRDAKTVSAKDIQSAKTALSEQMIPKAQTALEKLSDESATPVGASTVEIISQVLLTEELSAEIGEEVQDLTIESSVKYIAVTINMDALKQVAENAFSQDLSSGLQLVSVNADSFTFSSTNFDLEEGYADLQITAAGLATVRLSSDIFDRSKLIGKDVLEIKAYFSNFDEVEQVSVDFSPFWLRKTPSLMDHIDIELTE